MPVSRVAIRRIIFGSSVLNAFGTIWAFVAIWAGTHAINVPQYRLQPAVVSIIGAVVLWVAYLIAACVRLGRMAKSLPASSNREELEYWQAAGMVIGMIFVLELFLIAIAAAVLGRTGHGTLIPPVITLVVGLHFFPFAPLFRIPAYYVIGAVMSLVSIVCIIAVSANLHLGMASLFVWSFIDGLSSAAILWAAALRVLAQGTLQIQADATPAV